MELPVAGPFVELAYVSSPAVRGLLVADGAIQALGAGLGLWGVLWRVRVRVPIVVRDDFGESGRALHVAAVPTVVGGGAPGLAVVGSF
jgi:hypothetical protein